MTYILTFAIFACAMAGIAVGIIFSGRKELPQSCGGVAQNPDCCMTCPEKETCDDAPQHDRDENPFLKQATGPHSGTPVAASRT